MPATRREGTLAGMWTASSWHQDLTELKTALTNKFKVDKQIKIDIFSMKKLDCESINDFVYRVERETLDLNLPDQLHSTMIS